MQWSDTDYDIMFVYLDYANSIAIAILHRYIIKSGRASKNQLIVIVTCLWSIWRLTTTKKFNHFFWHAIISYGCNFIRTKHAMIKWKTKILHCRISKQTNQWNRGKDMRYHWYSYTWPIIVLAWYRLFNVKLLFCVHIFLFVKRWGHASVLFLVQSLFIE